MVIVVMNFSGNVGKSTLSKHLLEPRLSEVKLIPVESINADDSDEEALRGNQFGEILESLLENENTVIDVGASNVEAFMSRMQQYKNSHEDFDLFLIPTVPSMKQQIDTVATIEALSTMGVPGEKIRVAFNRIEPEMNVSKSFSKVLGQLEMEPDSFEANPDIFIQENEVYALLQGQKLLDVASDPTNFDQKIKESKSKEERLQWAKKKGLRRLAMGAKEELDIVFRKLLPEVK